MLFSRVLQRELYATGGAVFAALFSIVLTTGLIRILGMAAGGEIGADAVVALLAFTVLNYLPVILSLTIFVATLTTLTRGYADSEMVVWFTAGQSLWAWVVPIMKFAGPAALFGFALSLGVTPWANQQANTYREKFEQRSDLARVSPGQFAESGRSDRVFFVESLSNDAQKVKNIFISSFDKGRLGVAFSSQGYLQQDADGTRYVVLENGRRYEGTPGAADYKIIEFQRYQALLDEKGVSARKDKSVRELPSLELIKQPSAVNLGELLWRLSVPLFGITLALLAIPLGFVNPRAGRSFNLVLAFLIYVIYTNTTSLLQGLVIQGKISFGLAWWPAHVTVAILAFLWISQRMRHGLGIHDHLRIAMSRIWFSTSSRPSNTEQS